MAARHIRRLQQKAEDVQFSVDDEADSEEGSKAPFNPFDLLSDDEVGLVQGSKVALHPGCHNHSVSQ